MVTLGYCLRCFLTKFLYFCLDIPRGFVGVDGRHSGKSDLVSLLVVSSSIGSLSSAFLSGPSPEGSEEN